MLRTQIVEDMKTAMKAGDAPVRDTLRMLDSMIKNEEISSGAREEGLDDAGVMTLLKRAIKQRAESAKQYRDGDRPELAEKEESETAILERYLPAQMSAEDVEKVVAEVIQEVGAEGSGDIGKVMGAAMKKVGDATDGNTVREAAAKLLG